MESLQSMSSILTSKYLSEKLSAWYGKDVKYVGFEFVGATGKGDSYLSDVFRILLIGKDGNNDEKRLQLILKVLPKNIARRKTFRCTEFFRNEIAFYDSVLPELLAFQKGKDVAEPFDSCPKVFALHCDGDNDIVMLEDLTVFGYGGPARQKGVDFEHCKIVVTTLAKFHALAMAFRDQHKDKFEEISSKLSETYYHDRNWGWYEGFWKRLTTCAIDAVENEYPNSIYSKKIKEFATPATFFNMAKAAVDSKENAVIGHGDMWTTNFLVKYSKEAPIHAHLIDFQLSRCASPILDLSFFIYACTEQDLRLKHYDDILKLYHDELSNHIVNLGSNAKNLYSWDVFMGEIKKYSFFGLGFSFESTPFIVLAPEDAMDVDGIQGTEKINIADVWTVKPFKDLAGRKREADNIAHAVDKGFI